MPADPNKTISYGERPHEGRSPSAPKGGVVRASAAVFVASFCTLVIELVAARIMAPYVGVSLYTWTSIIGVILAGISLGAYLGGILADRYPRHATLGWLLFLSGLTALAIVPLANIIGPADMLSRVAPSLISRVMLFTTAVFFLPALLLGMISPVTVKLALNDLSETGGVVGKIYAFSTLGSILGTFATGFVLVTWLGTRTIIVAVAVILMASAPVFGSQRTWKRRAVVVTAVIAGSLFLLGPSQLLQTSRQMLTPIIRGDYYYGESAYYTIRLRQSARPDGSWVETMVLDQLVHSFNDLRNPSYLHYGYLRIFEAIARSKESQPLRVLFIGGGGYTLPIQLEASNERIEIDVVEIDPAVSRVAYEYLGVPHSPRLRTFNDDARWFVMNSHAQYDFIFCDAFNDLSIPYHLTTLEFTQSLKRLLAPGGMVVANAIDDYERGRFLPSYARTLQTAFGPRNVALLAEGYESPGHGQKTFVIVASTEAPTLTALSAFLKSQQDAGGEPVHVTGPTTLGEYIARRNGILLTDDYAPVDNLLATLFDERYRYRAQF
jgi:predicted membrane-bound spermidine synthase